MLSRRPMAALLALAVLAATPQVLSAQTYPTKPVRIVTADAGGGADFVARQIAQGLTERFGHQVIVDNRAGSAIIPAQLVARASPDGYTLLVHGSTIWTVPLVQQNVPYDAIRDFAPVTLAVSSPNILVIHPSLPAKDVKGLIALAKARPGELNYGSAGTGSSTHIAAALFVAMANVDVVRVPYKGLGAAFTDLMSGQVQLMFANANAVTPHVASGRLRALAVTSARQSELAPGLPTVAESGLPGYESTTINGLFAPAATPAALIARLHEESVRVLRSPEVKARFIKYGTEVVTSSPAEFAAERKSYIEKISKVIKQAGIRE